MKKSTKGRNVARKLVTQGDIFLRDADGAIELIEEAVDRAIDAAVTAERLACLKDAADTGHPRMAELRQVADRRGGS